MAKAELKTKPTKADVEKFLNSIKDEKKREDSIKILKLMKQITKEEPKMWGSSIVGYGQYHYKYASGREGDWALTGFSPRKQNLVVYIMPGFEQFPTLMKRLGKFKTGKSCVYRHGTPLSNRPNPGRKGLPYQRISLQPFGKSQIYAKSLVAMPSHENFSTAIWRSLFPIFRRVAKLSNPSGYK